MIAQPAGPTPRRPTPAIRRPSNRRTPSWRPAAWPRSLWAPEFEFYIFDAVTYLNDINTAMYRIDSAEADWNSAVRPEDNLGHKIPRQGGYHACPPLDALYNLRAEMVAEVEAAGIPVRYHHHEVGGTGRGDRDLERPCARRPTMPCASSTSSDDGAAYKRASPSCPSRSSTRPAAGCTSTSG
jgi:hypothetical protein